VSRGKLISFEGLDGSGKSTQIALLQTWLDARQVDYVGTREPGGTALGVELRQLLLNRPDLAVTPLAETLLFQADRAQHFASLILPALDAGKLVITDRCFDASIAYQGHARGVGIELVTRLSMIATRGHLPDLTVLLDLDPSQVYARTDIMSDKSGLRQGRTRFDDEALEFHRQVREALLALAQLSPERIKLLDASRPAHELHAAVIALVKPLL
jgi:dTMP kinase